jgi:hypothetical protein
MTGSDVTEGHPKGVPLCVHMRNRKFRNIHPSGASSPEVTSSPIGLPLEVGGCSLGHQRPIFSMVTGTSPGYLPPFIFIVIF